MAICKRHTGNGKDWVAIWMGRIKGGVAAKAGYEKNSLASKIRVVLFRAPIFGRGNHRSSVFMRVLFWAGTLYAAARMGPHIQPGLKPNE